MPSGLDIPRIMEPWVSKVGNLSATVATDTYIAHRWDSRCSRLRRRRLESKCVRTASSKMGRRNRKTMKQFGKQFLSRLFPSFSKPPVATGLFHWDWSLHQHMDRHWSTTLPYLKRAKASSSSTPLGLSRLTQIPTVFVCFFISLIVRQN